MPGPHTPDGVPGDGSRRERFDAVVAGVIAELERPWRAELDGVEFGVEEVPWVEDDWQPERVPLATLVHGRSPQPTRIVVYRLPIRARLLREASTARERDLVYAALVDRIAELLGRSPDDVDPRVD